MPATEEMRSIYEGRLYWNPGECSHSSGYHSNSILNLYSYYLYYFYYNYLCIFLFLLLLYLFVFSILLPSRLLVFLFLSSLCLFALYFIVTVFIIFLISITTLFIRSIPIYPSVIVQYRLNYLLPPYIGGVNCLKSVQYAGKQTESTAGEDETRGPGGT